MPRKSILMRRKSNFKGLDGNAALKKQRKSVMIALPDSHNSSKTNGKISRSKFQSQTNLDSFEKSLSNPHKLSRNDSVNDLDDLNGSIHNTNSSRNASSVLDASKKKSRRKNDSTVGNFRGKDGSKGRKIRPSLINAKVPGGRISSMKAIYRRDNLEMN